MYTCMHSYCILYNQGAFLLRQLIFPWTFTIDVVLVLLAITSGLMIVSHKAKKKQAVYAFTK